MATSYGQMTLDEVELGNRVAMCINVEALYPIIEISFRCVAAERLRSGD